MFSRRLYVRLSKAVYIKVLDYTGVRKPFNIFFLLPSFLPNFSVSLAVVVAVEMVEAMTRMVIVIMTMTMMKTMVTAT